MSILPIGTVFAGYRIEAIAGQGGMGMVYRATQLALGRTVALKLIVPDLADDPGFRERFKRESQLAASIDHPNVLPVYEAGESDGLLFLSIRWVDGTDLRSLIVKEGPLEAERAVRIVEALGGALDEAHHGGLVHRDVKPANVLIRSQGEHVYLTDFGLTKRTTSAGGLTKTGMFVGTPDYTAPEQIKGEPADARSDVYALGCLFFHALTGHVPYPRDSEVAKMYAHLNDPPPSVATDVPGTPQALDAVVQQSMAKDPNERYATAGELGQAARAALKRAGQATKARSITPDISATRVRPAEPTAAGAQPPPPPAPPTPPPAAPAPPTPPPAGPQAPAAPAPPQAGPPRRRPPAAAIAGVAVLLVLAVVGVLALSGGGGGGDDGEESGESTTTTPAGPSAEETKLLGYMPAEVEDTCRTIDLDERSDLRGATAAVECEMDGADYVRHVLFEDRAAMLAEYERTNADLPEGTCVGSQPGSAFEGTWNQAEGDPTLGKLKCYRDEQGREVWEYTYEDLLTHSFLRNDSGSKDAIADAWFVAGPEAN